MLTTEYRPRTFQEIVGQPVNVELLQSIAKSPESSPRVLVFRGDFGTGKTTSARVFARALNCEDSPGEPCGACDICQAEGSFLPFYQEFDSSDVGSKEAIEGLKDDFFAQAAGVDWRVIVLDEFHLSSRQAQSALLKVLEDLPPHLFVILCTTDPDRILPTLRSRAVDLVFRKVPHVEAVKNLTRVAEAEKIEARPALIDLICRHTRGHVRDSVMLLDVFQSLEDKRSFINQLRSSEQELILLLMAIREGDREKATTQIEALLSTPLDVLRNDLHQVLQEAMKVYALGSIDSPYNEEYQALARLWKGELVKLMAFSMSDWAVNSFYDDRTVQAFLWSAFITFGKVKKQAAETTAQASRFRARR